MQDKDFVVYLNTYVDKLLDDIYHFDDKEYYEKKLLEVDSSYGKSTYNHDFLKNADNMTEEQLQIAENKARIVFEDSIVKKFTNLVHQYINNTYWVYYYVTKAKYNYFDNIFVSANGNHLGSITKVPDKQTYYLPDPKVPAEQVIEFCKLMSNKMLTSQHSHFRGKRQWVTAFYDQLRGRTAELATAEVLNEPIDTLDFEIFKGDRYKTDQGIDINPIKGNTPYQIKSALTLKGRDINIKVNRMEYSSSKRAGCNWMLTSDKMDMLFVDSKTMTTIFDDLFYLKYEHVYTIGTDLEQIEARKSYLQKRLNKKLNYNYIFMSHDKVEDLIDSNFDFNKPKLNKIDSLVKVTQQVKKNGIIVYQPKGKNNNGLRLSN